MVKKLGSRIAARAESSLGAVGTFSFNRPFTTLSLVAAACAVSLWLASRLEVNADLSALLPKSFPSVQAFDV